ncbi:MAG: hypothetical protein HZB39_08445 [Planctomycetes bacterium]|nr:hypothetical protein [Planctomycetota bacterium]
MHTRRTNPGSRSAAATITSLASLLAFTACATGDRWVERLPDRPDIAVRIRYEVIDLGLEFLPPSNWPDAHVAGGCGLGDDGTASFTIEHRFPGANGQVVRNAQIQVYRANSGHTVAAPGSIAGYAGRVNSLGQTSGSSLFGNPSGTWVANTLRPVFVGTDDSVSPLTDQNAEGHATAVNESGVVVGFRDGGNGLPWGFPSIIPTMWDSATAAPRTIGPSGPWGMALDVDRSGNAVGFVQINIDGSFATAGWVHRTDGSVAWLGSDAEAISETGYIAVNDHPTAHVYRLDGTHVWELLPLSPGEGAWSHVRDVNDAGTCIGESNGRAVVWSAYSTRRGVARCRDINRIVSGLLPAGVELTAGLRLNKSGQLLCRGVVTSANGSIEEPHVFLIRGLSFIGL